MAEPGYDRHLWADVLTSGHRTRRTTAVSGETVRSAPYGDERLGEAHEPLSHGRPGTRQEALDAVLATELVSVSELSLLFPSSEIWRERFVGLTKSLVAVRS